MQPWINDIARWSTASTPAQVGEFTAFIDRMIVAIAVLAFLVMVLGYREIARWWRGGKPSWTGPVEHFAGAVSDALRAEFAAVRKHLTPGQPARQVIDGACDLVEHLPALEELGAHVPAVGRALPVLRSICASVDLLAPDAPPVAMSTSEPIPESTPAAPPAQSLAAAGGEPAPVSLPDAPVCE